MGIPIFFADLTHTYQGISSLAFPLGASLIASYAKKNLEDKIDVEIFKYPKNLKESIETKERKFACFSNYSWSLNISNEFAERIKKKNPEAIIVFGGPNYPLDKEEQEKFLLSHPTVDFYIEGEGERGFLELFKALEELDFDVKKFKNNKIRTGNSHYISDGEIIIGETLARLENLDEIPSPYLTGLLDKFFDGVLTPIIQTTRGCPFKCTYCQEGDGYFNKISRFSKNRVKKELEYIAEKASVPNLIVTDSNFGMYKEDLETCKDIASIKRKYSWPRYIEGNFGKNKKVVLEAVAALEGGICLSAPVQSTDPEVLSNIKRKNISIERIMELVRGGESYGANNFSEIILGLPGDTKEAHFKSMSEMIDLGINVVRSHQLIMLPGSEMSMKKSRKKFGIETRYRLQPVCFGNYKLENEVFPACEVDEICIANKTMSYGDYLECRAFDLSVEIFYNNGVFKEPISLLLQKGIPASSFIKDVNEKIAKSQLNDLYEKFLEENRNSLWESEKKLREFIIKPGMIDNYIKNELRNNEQLKYRALAIFTRMEDLHKVAFDSIENFLDEQNHLNDNEKDYLNQLREFSLLRKNNLLSLDFVNRRRFNYDFAELLNGNFRDNPFSHYKPKGVEIEFFHSNEQKELINSYVKQLGSSMNSLGFILSRSHANKFYRKARKL